METILNLNRDIDGFTRGYIEAALWSSTDGNGEPLDKDYNWTHLAGEALQKIITDCAKFQAENSEALASAVYPQNDSTNAAHAGHDFWLTRNGHGSGFWDGDLPEEVGDNLTKASEAFGECNLYIGNDGKLYLYI